MLAQIVKKLAVFLVIVLFAFVLVLILNKKTAKNEMFNSHQNVSSSTTSTVSVYKEEYKRNFDIPNPILSAKGVIVKELGSQQYLYKQKIFSPWPMASITKLLTAVVVAKNINPNTSIAISSSSVQDEYSDLLPGEIYKAFDLLKIMLMSSSNKAAVSFEEYLGKENFLAQVREILREVGMTNTEIYESSGLDSRNVSTPYDIALLLEYLLQKYPQILTWTRISSFTFQPINSTAVKNVTNINPLKEETNFLGGKTGTSWKASQNLAVIMQVKDKKMAIVIMGSEDRFKDLSTILRWVQEVYQL